MSRLPTIEIDTYDGAHNAKTEPAATSSCRNMNEGAPQQNLQAPRYTQVATMPIGLLVIGAIPTVIGVAEAISAQKQQNQTHKETIKFGIGITAIINGVQEEAQGILTEGKLFLSHGQSPVEGFPFEGWYFMYPSEEQHMGLVTMTSKDPPAMGWIFVDADTRVVRYGGRKDTIGNVFGPWHWSPNETLVTLRESAGGFIAVKEDEGPRWYVAWDPDGGLREQLGPERSMPIVLRRQTQSGVESRYVKD